MAGSEAAHARALSTLVSGGVNVGGRGTDGTELPPRAEHEALRAARERLGTKEGRRRYARRAGIEGTLSQGVRAFGLRRSRYRGLAKTHLQHVATAAAVNLERLAAWFRSIPHAATRTSRFAALATLNRLRQRYPLFF